MDTEGKIFKIHYVV